MSAIDTKEWFQIADDDFYVANELCKLEKKPLGTNSYHCTQGTEKYLKGFLVYHQIIPRKTHNLLELLDKCIGFNRLFQDIMAECDLIKMYSNEIRYPGRAEVTETYMRLCIDYTKKVLSLPIFHSIKKEIGYIEDNSIKQILRTIL